MSNVIWPLRVPSKATLGEAGAGGGTADARVPVWKDAVRGDPRELPNTSINPAPRVKVPPVPGGREEGTILKTRVSAKYVQVHGTAVPPASSRTWETTVPVS